MGWLKGFESTASENGITGALIGARFGPKGIAIVGLSDCRIVGFIFDD